MNRATRISFGIGCIVFGLSLLVLLEDFSNFIGLGLVGCGIAQFIGLPKDNVVPFRRRPR